MGIRPFIKDVRNGYFKEKGRGKTKGIALNTPLLLLVRHQEDAELQMRARLDSHQI